MSTTSIEPFIAGPEGAEPENLGLLHIAVERKHDRPSVLRQRASTVWQDTPDWRFHRHVVRIGLYLHERAQLNQGDRIALLSRLRPEWAVAEWAALTMGAATAVIATPTSRTPTCPRSSLLSRPASCSSKGPPWSACSPAARRLAARSRSSRSTARSQEGPRSRGPRRSISGVASTPPSERTPIALKPEPSRRKRPRWGHAVGANGSVTWRFLSHRDVVRRVQRVWTRARIARGDVAYLAGDVPSLATNVALLAFTADGHTQVVIGTGSRELEDIAMTHPHKIIASPEAVRRLLESPKSPEPSREFAAGWRVRPSRARAGATSATGGAFPRRSRGGLGG